MKETNARFSTNRSSSDTSLRDIIAPLFRRRRLMGGIFLAVLALAILFGLLVPPTFTSHMAILVDRERLDPLVTTESTTQMIAPSTPTTEVEINSEAELLSSRDVLEKVVHSNNLADKHGFSLIDLLRPNETKENRVARAVKSLAKKLKIVPVPKTNLIDVGYSSPDPQLSYGVLKSLGDFYIEKHAAVHRPHGSYEFFAEQTAKYHDALGDSESRLRDFGRDQGVAAPDLQRTNMALQVTNAIGLSHVAQQAIASDEERIRSDRQQLQVTPERSQTQEASAAADKLLGSLYPTLLAAQTKRTQLAMKYEPTYPLVTEADKEIAQANEAIAAAEKTRYVTATTDRDPTYELLREDLAKSQIDLAAQRANLRAILLGVQKMQAQMIVLDKQALTQQDLMRDAKANEGNYLLYLAKREQELTSDALDKTRIGNAAIAVPPAIPVLPVYSFLWVLAVGLGLATSLSIAAVYVFEYFDSSFHTPAQVIDILGIPVVIAVSKKTA